MKFEKSSRIAAELIGESMLKELTPYTIPEDCYVKLTEELADQVVQMYKQTDWDSLENKDVYLPDSIFLGEMDVAGWKGHIGEYILVRCYGEPWTEIHESPVFVPGVQIEFAEDLLWLSRDLLHDLLEHEDVTNCFFTLSGAIRNMLLNGVPEEDIRKDFRKRLDALRK